MRDAIEEEISEARRLYGVHQRVLSSHQSLSHKLARYRECIERTDRSMREIGIAGACSACAKKAGSCCFREIENCYDRVALLVNLLLKAPLPEKREIEGNCYFLGERGCKLIARDSFCINYLCGKLKTDLGSSAVTRFSAVAGEEIYCGWQIELILRKWLAAEVGSTAK
ncbi:MAG: hypothetical protein JXA30_18985 [Deltaproteobacteria bacterium]|nr:hypothetical protein [Deltaproteobacteria bacterium]